MRLNLWEANFGLDNGVHLSLATIILSAIPYVRLGELTIGSDYKRAFL